MTKHTQPTRICTACGIQKPLTAFLHLTSKLGTAYGSICSTCRGKGIKEEVKKLISDEEKSSTTSSLRIGMKQLVEIELQKKREQKDRQDNKELELKKREQVSVEKTESTELKEKADKLQRETYQRGFLDYKSKKNPFSAQSVLDQKNAQRFMGAPVPDEKQRAMEATKKTEAIKQEQQKNSVDLSGAPVLDPANFTFAREATVQRLQSLLGNDAPIMRNMAQFYKTLSIVEGKKPDSAKQEKWEGEDPREFIERTWGPSSRKR